VTEDFLGFSKFLQKYREVPYFSLRSVLRSSLRNHCIVHHTLLLEMNLEQYTLYTGQLILLLIFVTLLHVSTFRLSLGFETNTISKN